MNIRLEKHYRKIALTAFLVIAASMLFYFLLFRTTTLGFVLNKIFAVLSPIIYGFVIAYVLNPLVIILEEKIAYKIILRLKLTPGLRCKKAMRVICVFLALFLMGFVIYLIISSIVPELIHSIRSIIRNYPTYAENVKNFFEQIFKSTEIDEKASEIFDTVFKSFQTWYETDVAPRINSLALSVTSGFVNFFTFMKNILLGMIISIYILISKEAMLARFRRFIYAVFSIERANRILHTLRFADAKFGGFLIGKLIDSVIIGLLCYICCLTLRMPYSTLIAVIIGVTNIIPFFGPLIGAVPCTLLIFVVSPLKSLIFIIFILGLQQFDGNFLGPKILGSSVGVSSYMVILSILIGSGFFGFKGMIISVPLCAVLLALLQTHIVRKAHEKGIPADLESYHYVRQINPETKVVENESTEPDDGGLYEVIRHRDEELKNFDEPILPRPWDRTYEQIAEEDAQIGAPAVPGNVQGRSSYSNINININSNSDINSNSNSNSKSPSP